MKIYAPGLFFMLSLLFACTGLKKTYLVKGTLTQTSSYCGGAAPDEEIMRRLNTPQPFVGIKLYIFKQDDVVANKVYKTVVTDSEGNFSLQLSTGKYCIKDSTQLKVWEMDKSYAENFDWDSLCLVQRYNQCSTPLEVKKSSTSVQINFHIDCFYQHPCGTYKGQLPPTPAPER